MTPHHAQDRSRIALSSVRASLDHLGGLAIREVLVTTSAGRVNGLRLLNPEDPERLGTLSCLGEGESVTFTWSPVGSIDETDPRLVAKLVHSHLTGSNKNHGSLARTAASPWSIAETSFDVKREQVRETRRWIARNLPSECEGVDPCKLIVSELFGNAVRHSQGGTASLTLTHTGDGRVLGRLVHLAPPEGTPELNPKVVAEIAKLSEMSETDAPDISELAEGGRGLVVVRLLCSGPLDIHVLPDRLSVSWVVDACRCGGEVA